MRAVCRAFVILRCLFFSFSIIYENKNRSTELKGCFFRNQECYETHRQREVIFFQASANPQLLNPVIIVEVIIPYLHMSTGRGT